jgi:hypothetical protein
MTIPTVSTTDLYTLYKIVTVYKLVELIGWAGGAAILYSALRIPEPSKTSVGSLHTTRIEAARRRRLTRVVGGIAVLMIPFMLWAHYQIPENADTSTSSNLDSTALRRHLELFVILFGIDCVAQGYFWVRVAKTSRANDD